MTNEFDTSKVQGSEKYISNQLFNRYLNTESQTGYEMCLFEFILERSHYVAQKEDFFPSDKHTIDEMASSPVSTSFLCFLASLINASTIVEIGSFVGFATINLALNLGENGKIYSIEKFDQFAQLAAKNAEKFGVGHKVEVITGDAKKLLPKLLSEIKKLDLAFVDGNKEHYLEYVKFFAPALRRGGVMLVDDCFFHGDTVKPHPETPKGKGVRAAVDYLSNHDEFTVTILPISNGLLLAKKN